MLIDLERATLAASQFGLTATIETGAAPVLRALTTTDYAARDELHDLVFGPGALTRTAYRVREGTAGHSPWCHGYWVGDELIAMIRYTPITIGGQGGAIMLGPLAVHPAWENKGFGRKLIAHGHAKAQAEGVKIVILVGDVGYYARLGFLPIPAGQIMMPGPVDKLRLLALELQPDALKTFSGVIKGAAPNSNNLP
jgi:predicted N-acetyltransferase YhbS